MAVLQMQKLCICALKKDRKSLMEFLQAAGVLELTAEAEPDEVFKRTDTLEDRQKFERNAATADRALEVLAAVVPEETSMLAGLAGKPLAKAGAYRETEANAEALLGQAERILNLQKQITEEKTAALRLLAEAESLKPWQKLEIPLAYQETKRCAILAGAVGGGAYTQEEIYASVAKQEPQLEKWESKATRAQSANRRFSSSPKRLTRTFRRRNVLLISRSSCRSKTCSRFPAAVRW